MDIQSALVLSILQKWRAYTWTIQGFGFIRTKIQNVGRIHVWDSTLTVPRVSTMHTHPWALKSRVISGELINQRFHSLGAHSSVFNLPYLQCDIATGEGGGLLGEAVPVFLSSDRPEFYGAGLAYSQEAGEIHRSIPQDGTVTLMEREQGPPLEKATVFWPVGTHWVSAEPRPAQVWETEKVIRHALARWAPAL